MSAKTRTVALLSAARVAIREADGNVSRYGFDAAKLSGATPKTHDYMVRSSLSQNVISVAENLNGIKDASIRSKYPSVFGDIREITGVRNVLAHQYGHADELIDWARVWMILRGVYPRLESAIDKAIDDLESVGK